MSVTRLKDLPAKSSVSGTDYIVMVSAGVAHIATFEAAGIVGTKHKITPEGGVAVRLTNKTGATSVKGTIVTVSSTTNNAVAKITVDIPTPIGAIYEDGIADGSEVWVVVSGIADVYFIGSTTRGMLARGFVTGDAGYVSGEALAENAPTSPFATDKHFYEIGHILESRTGAGLAKIIMHFN
ncbi:MAG: hypothetical protein WCP20_10945 [Desulfuromonadales bacterium]